MELLHLAQCPSSLHEPTAQAPQALHRSLSVDFNAPSVSFPANSHSNSTWVMKPVGDDGRVFDGLSLSSSLDRRNHAPKLILSNTHGNGCIPGHDYCQIGGNIYRFGHDLHALPPRKLRKLLTTFSDGVHVFSCVERVGVLNSADFEWSKNGVDPINSFLSRKRSWQVCGMNWGGAESADANSGDLGLSGIYQRLTDVIMPHEGNGFHMQDSGSGGNSNGGGHGQGGDGHGHHGFGPEQPGSDERGLPFTTGWYDEQEDGAMVEEAGIHSTNIPNIRKHDGVTMVSDERIVREGRENENCSEELYGMLEAPYQFFHKVLEHLRRAVSPFNSELNKLFDHGEATMVKENSSHIPFWQYDVQHLGIDHALESNDHGELRTDLQDIDEPLADYTFRTEINGDLIEKLNKLTLGSIKHLLPHAEHMLTDNPIRFERGPTQKEDRGGNNTEFKFTINLLSAENDRLSNNQTSSSLKTKAEEKFSANQQLQGVMAWLDNLAHSVSARHGENQQRPEIEGQVQDQKLKTLINEAVVSALKQLSDTGGISTPPKQADTETLRRLQREVFSELLKIREKLDQMALARGSDSGRNLSGAGKTILKGEVKVGTAVVMLEDSSSRHSRGSLEQAGMQTGVDVRLTFETRFREKDLLITECIAGQGSTVGEGRSLGGPMSLGKVHYLAHINDGISISFVPIGAQGMDVTDIVNPMQDQGLTAFSSRGPAHFDHCKGSAIGATWSGSSFAVSAAQYLSGWGNHAFSLGTDTRESGPLCLSTLGQLLLQPRECLIFSLSGLNRFWPSPPLPSSMGLHWSEMGPLVIPKIQSLHTSRSTFSSEDSFLSHCNSVGSHWGMLDSEYNLDTPESKGTSLLSVAVASEMEISKDLSLGAWAQVEMGDVLQDLDKGNFQWALNVSKTSKNGVDWGAGVGSSRPDFWSASTSDQEMYPGFGGGVGDSYGPQLHLEAFVKLNCGRGFTLQPGLLYLLNKHSHTPAFIVRSSWFF